MTTSPAPSIVLGILAALVGAASAPGCDREPADGFCGALEAAPGCNGELAQCRDEIDIEHGQNPRCIAQLADLEDCLETLDLSCDPGVDFNVYANGDGTEDPNFAAYIGPYRLNVRDAACLDAAKAWENCTLCSGAVGFDSDLGGVGDPCGSGSDCAEGLQCSAAGGCSRACVSDSDCLPKHGLHECVTINDRVGVCDDGLCATYCRGNAYEIYACPP